MKTKTLIRSSLKYTKALLVCSGVHKFEYIVSACSRKLKTYSAMYRHAFKVHFMENVAEIKSANSVVYCVEMGFFLVNVR